MSLGDAELGAQQLAVGADIELVDDGFISDGVDSDGLAPDSPYQRSFLRG